MGYMVLLRVLSRMLDLPRSTQMLLDHHYSGPPLTH